MGGEKYWTESRRTVFLGFFLFPPQQDSGKVAHVQHTPGTGGLVLRHTTAPAKISFETHVDYVDPIQNHTRANTQTPHPHPSPALTPSLSLHPPTQPPPQIGRIDQKITGFLPGFDPMTLGRDTPRHPQLPPPVIPRKTLTT